MLHLLGGSYLCLPPFYTKSDSWDFLEVKEGGFGEFWCKTGGWGRNRLWLSSCGILGDEVVEQPSASIVRLDVVLLMSNEGGEGRRASRRGQGQTEEKEQRHTSKMQIHQCVCLLWFLILTMYILDQGGQRSVSKYRVSDMSRRYTERKRSTKLQMKVVMCFVLLAMWDMEH